MIEHDVGQGTPAWFRLRQGIPTASEFASIVTPVKGDLSEGWKRYAARLIWQKLVNDTADSLDHLEHVARGKELEPVAVKQLEFVNEIRTRKIGFVTTDDGLVGASPDRFIEGTTVPVEIKAPSGPVHMQYMLFGHEASYRPQIQGQLWVCEAERGIFYSYVDCAPAYQVETTRDEPYIKKLAAALRQFTDHLQELEHRARAMGAFQAFEDVAMPADREYSEQPTDKAYGMFPYGDPRWLESG